jgi:hypothetical protein
MRLVRLLAAAAAGCLGLAAQFGVPPAPDVVLVGEFRTALPEAQVLASLDAYYQEQVGRKLDAVLPEIAPGVRYEVWHDMWMYLASRSGQLTVTMKRPGGGSTVVLAKGWMLQLAGRVAGDAPVRFEQLPAMRYAEGDIYGSRTELARVLEDEPEFRAVRTWQHAGLMVSVSRLARVTLAPAGHRGIHHFTAGAETLEAARQLAAKVSRIRGDACVCAVYSEAGEVTEDLHRQAVDKSADMTSTTAAGMVLLEVDPKHIEDSLRAEPANQKRLAAAAGWYGVKYRIEAPYARVTIRWSELEGYTRGSGKFTGERPVGASSTADVKPTGAGKLVESRVRMEPLKPGAYRIAIEGETAGGAKVAIDQRDFWFDGIFFDEL